MAAGQAKQEQGNENEECLRQPARLKQTSFTKQQTHVLLRGRLKSEATANKTKEAPAATGKLNKTKNYKEQKPAATGQANTKKFNNTKQTPAATGQAESKVPNNNLKEHPRLRAS